MHPCVLSRASEKHLYITHFVQVFLKTETRISFPDNATSNFERKYRRQTMK